MNTWSAAAPDSERECQPGGIASGFGEYLAADEQVDDEHLIQLLAPGKESAHGKPSLGCGPSQQHGRTTDSRSHLTAAFGARHKRVKGGALDGP